MVIPTIYYALSITTQKVKFSANLLSYIFFSESTDQGDDGTIVKVSYTVYPPSPVGDANLNKITLEFAEGSIKIGDRMEALGRIDKESNTIMVSPRRLH
jgi:hypothetical protein